MAADEQKTAMYLKNQQSSMSTLQFRSRVQSSLAFCTTLRGPHALSQMQHLSTPPLLKPRPPVAVPVRPLTSTRSLELLSHLVTSETKSLCAFDYS
ncbi:hypothetical protein PRIPAC_96192 [Pristionchus pacificus]|uniref:Uncharacterized protein n=1 Tax=Pristionchus pacificus TaxID=54126 RepID=A0A2A6BDF1_PRIPA|nr:hypothetical protein PRIPAC_96192 [Pristionchus pacificus]|eukprot:PDM63871.1 hypothetical protein PRIPAC_49844 [Pristionchus pacificus]